MKLSQDHIDEIVAHAREEAPNECCGIVATENGVVVKAYRTTNIHRSPTRFEIPPQDVMRISSEIEERGWGLGIYHSHTKSAAYPSQTDVNFAEFWPGVVWLIVSLEKPDTPDVRSFEIVDGKVRETPLEIA